MTDKQHGGKREGAGRPKLPDSERKAKVTIRLSPEQRQWVIEKGGAAYIRELIEKDKGPG